MDFEKDLDMMFKFMGTTASHNGVVGKIILDLPSVFDNQFVTSFGVSNKQATMKSSQWPDLTTNSIILVGATSYKVTSVKLIDDGLVKVVELK